MSRHVRAETLARRREGKLSARKEASIDAHLSGCARCAGTSADLAAVSNLLARTQLPPMPDSLAERVQMAIASESAERAARVPAPATGKQAAGPVDVAADVAAGAAGAGRRRAARRLRRPRLSSPLVLRGLAGTAAVVAVAGVGFLLASGHTTQNGQNRSASGAPAGSGAHRASSTTRPLVNGAAGQSRPVSLHYRLRGKIATTTALSSSTNFRRDSLARNVRKDVATTARFGPNASAVPTPTGLYAKTALPEGLSVSRLEGCLGRVDAGRKILVVTIARFQGKPAAIVALRSLRAADLFDVTVVGPSCSASHADVIYQTTIPAS